MCEYARVHTHTYIHIYIHADIWGSQCVRNEAAARVCGRAALPFEGDARDDDVGDVRIN